MPYSQHTQGQLTSVSKEVKQVTYDVLEGYFTAYSPHLVVKIFYFRVNGLPEKGNMHVARVRVSSLEFIPLLKGMICSECRNMPLHVRYDEVAKGRSEMEASD